MDCSLIEVDEKAIGKSVHPSRRTIDSEDKTAQGALLRAFVKEVEIFPDDEVISCTIPRGPDGTHSRGTVVGRLNHVSCS